MKIVIFDLGNTLEHNDKLITGAFETLSNIRSSLNGRITICCLDDKKKNLA